MPVATRASTRSEKKRRTRERILANAVALFRERGVRATRMSEVAAASEISSATLFNYFATKGILAEAWVRGELEAELIHATREAVEHDRSLRSALRNACRALAAASASEPELRLEAWREAGRASGEEGVGAGPLVEDLRKEQERERVRSDVSARDLAEMLTESIEGGLIAGLTDASGGPSPSRARMVPKGPDTLEGRLAQAIRTRVDLVLDGFRKRNERVSVSARSTSDRGATGARGATSVKSPPAMRPGPST